MNDFRSADNPLLSDSSRTWDDLIQSVGPASLLLTIEHRMGAALKSKIRAEDILQESLLHAWRDRGKVEWRGLRSFRSWLLTIIDNRINLIAHQQGALRRGGNENVRTIAGLDGADFRAPGSVMPLVSTTPSRVALYREQAAAMHSSLAALPEEVREIVRLRLFEQRTLDQISEILAINVPTVRYRFARGLEQYRTKLREYFSSMAGAAASRAAQESSAADDSQSSSDSGE
jgi:RNA polymerase sigma factor (sigma-70 family)